MAGDSPSGEDIFVERWRYRLGCCFSNREQTHPSDVAVYRNQKEDFSLRAQWERALQVYTARIFPPATVPRAGRGLLGQLMPEAETHLPGFLGKWKNKIPFHVWRFECEIVGWHTEKPGGVDRLVKEVVEFKALPGTNRLISGNLNGPGLSLFLVRGAR